MLSVTILTTPSLSKFLISRMSIKKLLVCLLTGLFSHQLQSQEEGLETKWYV